MCVRICVSISVHVWMYVSWHVYAHANMCATRVALSGSVSLMSIIAGHRSEVLMATRSTQQKHSSNNNNNTATTTLSVCLMNRGVRVGAASITDEPKKHLR